MLRTIEKQNAFWLEYENRNYWDTRTARWIGMPRLVNFYLDLLENDIRSFLSKQRGKILDIGCGDGRFLAYADVGADFSKGMLKRAKQKKSFQESCFGFRHTSSISRTRF